MMMSGWSAHFRFLVHRTAALIALAAYALPVTGTAQALHQASASRVEACDAPCSSDSDHGAPAHDPKQCPICFQILVVSSALVGDGVQVPHVTVSPGTPRFLVDSRPVSATSLDVIIPRGPPV